MIIQHFLFLLKETTFYFNYKEIKIIIMKNIFLLPRKILLFKHMV